MRKLIVFIALITALATPAFAKSNASADMPSCSSSDPVVWINTKSNVYHVKGDKYFGNTKQGKYACQSQAAKLGAHAAKSSAMSKGVKGQNGEDNGATQGSANASKHKHKHGEGSPSPAST